MKGTPQLHELIALKDCQATVEEGAASSEHSSGNQAGNQI